MDPVTQITRFNKHVQYIEDGSYLSGVSIMSIHVLGSVLLLLGIAAAVGFTIASMVMTTATPAVTVFVTGP